MTYFGVNIVTVAIGTVVGRDKTGKDMVVTDVEAVSNGQTIWVTERHYDLIKAASESNAA